MQQFQVPPLIRMPRRAAAVRPLTTLTGVEITSAQGQAMISSASARYTESSQAWPSSSGGASATSTASPTTAGV
ncbi:Uncharacterised protein [Bordetella pertussis]|nr:Uncharacterised protein [Bordetella pertussis]